MKMKIKIFVYVVLFLFPFSGITQKKELTIKEIRNIAEQVSIDEAIKKANTYIKTHKNEPSGYSLLAELYIEKGGFEYFKKAEVYLDRALRINPRFIDGLVNFGRLKILTKDYALAERFLKRALRLDPNNINAYKGMMELYQKERNPRVLEQLKMYLERGKLSADSSADIQLMLTRAMIKNGELDKAEKTLVNLKKKFPENPVVNLLLSDLYFEQDNFSEFSQYYLNGLENLKDKNELERRFLDMYEIMSDNEITEYKRLPLEKKGAYLVQFWKSVDVNGATEENERLIEHFKRLKIAKTIYRSPIPPYYDDRGRVYIKWGPPDSRYLKPMGTILGNELSRPTESWSYESINKNLVFDFVEKGGIYKEVRDLSEAIVGGGIITSAVMPDGSPNPNLLKLATLYSERSNLSSLHNRLGNVTDWEVFFNDIQESNIIKETAKKEVPPSVSKYEFPFSPMNIAVSCAQFKGENGKTKIELYYAIFPEEQFFEDDTGTEIIGSLDNTFVIRDSLLNIIQKVDDKSEIRLKKGMDLKNVTANYQRNFLTSPGKHTFWIQVKSKRAHKGGIIKIEKNLRDFNTNRLMVSDIEFSEKIERADKPDVNVKNGLRISPYPFGEVYKDKPINIYYEIYNLRYDKNGNTNFQIEQTIKPMKENKTIVERGIKKIGDLLKGGQQEAITSIYRRTGNSINDFEYVILDVSKITNGKKTLSIKVTDLISGKSVETSKDFIVK
ncbi:hypothetical protein DRQ09_09400 [candidate division KSB1 bacterium]|nr:MAG: hypothetical protein DRQ09_09400 [candidate division KSB1 bacterium]